MLFLSLFPLASKCHVHFCSATSISEHKGRYQGINLGGTRADGYVWADGCHSCFRPLRLIPSEKGHHVLNASSLEDEEEGARMERRAKQEQPREAVEEVLLQ